MDCYLEQMRTRLLLSIKDMQKDWHRFPELIQRVQEATTLNDLIYNEGLIDEMKESLADETIS